MIDQVRDPLDFVIAPQTFKVVHGREHGALAVGPLLLDDGVVEEAVVDDEAPRRTSVPIRRLSSASYALELEDGGLLDGVHAR